jgi:hypothetical protein
MRATHPLVGKVFGRLKIIRVLSAPPSKNTRRMCCAECRCGSGRKLYGLKNIKRGTTKSCGCYRREQSARTDIRNTIRHGQCANRRRTRTYISWLSASQRCLNPNATGYKYWGGRGIAICRRWRGRFGFAHFFEDMHERPAGKSLDRKNPDKGYSKSNCRWATPKEQRAHLRKAA